MRPVRPVPFGIDELRTHGQPAPARRARLTELGRLFQRLDQVLHVYERRPIRRAAARRDARGCALDHRAPGGRRLLGRHPAAVGLLAARALHLLGYDRSTTRDGRPGSRALDRFAIRRTSPDGRAAVARGLPVARCGTPRWPSIALLDAGVPADDPPLVRPPTGCSARRSRVRGDWSVRRPQLAPGGWAFEFAQRQLPGHRRHRRGRARAAPGRRTRDRARLRRRRRPGDGLERSACSPGTAAGAPSTPTTPATLADELPFCDFGEVIDPPSADVTAHVVEMLAADGLEHDAALPTRHRLAARRTGGRRRLVRPLGRQLRLRHRARRCRRWSRPGCRRTDPAIRRAVRWLEEHQNADGGWGEDLRSYPDPGWAGAAPPPRRRPPGRCWRCLPAGERDRSPPPAASAGWSRPSARTAPGTSRTSPAPASPATSPSTTTSTGWSSRSPRSAATCAASPS